NGACWRTSAPGPARRPCPPGRSTSGGALSGDVLVRDLHTYGNPHVADSSLVLDRVRAPQRGVERWQQIGLPEGPLERFKRVSQVAAIEARALRRKHRADIVEILVSPREDLHHDEIFRRCHRNGHALDIARARTI